MSFSWFLVGALAGAGGMYVAAKEKVWKPNPTETIAEVDFDEADAYVGSSNDGVYVQAAQGPDGGWYVSGVVDSDTGSFVDALFTDDGPYDSHEEAVEAGKNAAADWCIDNNVDYDVYGDGEEEEEYEPPDEDELRTSAVIQERRDGYAAVLEGKALGTFKDGESALAALNNEMDRTNYWPNIYYVNERGNTDLIDREWNVLASWV